MTFTAEQALSFAPDDATAQRGADLASLQMWRSLSYKNQYLWGACKSSGSSYYQTQVSLQGPAFKCTCPSRKFPCKHAIALLLLYIQQTANFQQEDHFPEYVREWALSRGEVLTEDNSSHVAAQAPQRPQKIQWSKAQEARIEVMRSGISDLESWLQDLIRQGLASVEGQHYTYWQGIASRMVDAKLGGVARRIRQLQLLPGTGNEWPQQMFSELAQLYLLVKGFEQLEQLPDILQRELLTVSGMNIKSADVLTERGTWDDWLVLGIFEGVEENLNFRHTWLYGANTEKYALVLEYVFGDQGYPNTWRTGQAFNGEVVYYPSAYPLRALVKQQKSPVGAFEAPIGHPNLNLFFDDYSLALAQNPWLYYYPCYLENVVPTTDNGRLFLIDQQEKYIEAIAAAQIPWKLISLSGGAGISIFGEWTGEYFLPLSVLLDNNLVEL